uniref:Uncharacterized protein n=1 Tax=Glossina brevipalpis TaxID=37001 RepID=A0A1A9WNR2_9MUSC
MRHNRAENKKTHKSTTGILGLMIHTYIEYLAELNPPTYLAEFPTRTNPRIGKYFISNSHFCKQVLTSKIQFQKTNGQTADIVTSFPLLILNVKILFLMQLLIDDDRQSVH